jgi:UDP-2-acetamido-2-deoxy-ribo-hexuluronate aminotransferase
MRYILSTDIIVTALKQPDTFAALLNIAGQQQLYICAGILPSIKDQITNEQLVQFKQLIEQLHLAKVPSYLDPVKLLNATDSSAYITNVAAPIVDAIVVTDQATDSKIESISLAQLLTPATDNHSNDIAFINLKDQYHSLQPQMEAAIDSTLTSGQFIMGSAIDQFEHKLAEFTGAKHAISCSSGSDALLLALMAIDIQPGDEVIVPSFTFIASASMPALLGAKLVFIDVDPHSYNLDIKELQTKVNAHTRAIIPVGLYGQPAAMEQINQIAAKAAGQYGSEIHIIEDAAQSLGGTYKGTQSGNLSSLATTSFFPAKPLGAYGDAGAVFTNNDQLATKIKALRIHGGLERYQHQYIGLNGRCDSVQAAILSVKLAHFPQEIILREKIAQKYHTGLQNIDIVLPRIADGFTSSWAQYSIQVTDRESFIAHLNAAKIPCAIHYPLAAHLQPCFAKYGFTQGDFPVAEALSHKVVSLPFSPYLPGAQQDYIISVIQDYFSQ